MYMHVDNNITKDELQTCLSILFFEDTSCSFVKKAQQQTTAKRKQANCRTYM